MGSKMGIVEYTPGQISSRRTFRDAKFAEEWQTQGLQDTENERVRKSLILKSLFWVFFGRIPAQEQESESKGVGISTQRSRRSQRGAKEEIDRRWLAANTGENSTL